MPALPLSRETCVETLAAVKRYADRGYPLEPEKGTQEPGAYSMAGGDLGINRETVRNRVNRARERYGLTVENFNARPESIIEDDRPDPIAILDRHAPVNAQYIALKRTKPQLFIVKREPFCIAFIGDPHLSNAGCNLHALRHDIDFLRATGIRAVQMGDILDNFHRVPKLAAKEAQNRMSIEEALSVAKWLILDSGVKWDAHVLGNHDLWLDAEGVALFGEWIRQARSRMYDWNARLIYQWGDGPNDRHAVMASHDMKGHSQYNPTHGPGKMALWDGTHDTYVAAHRHNHAEAKIPNGWRARTYQLARVRGYKDFDSYSAGRAQFPDHLGMEGRSAMLVVNPLSETHDGRQRVFMDIQEGAEYCEMLRRRAGVGS